MKIKLVHEEKLVPNLSKYKLPPKLVDKKYHLNEITLECDDMNLLRKKLWFIPVAHL